MNFRGFGERGRERESDEFYRVGRERDGWDVSCREVDY